MPLETVVGKNAAKVGMVVEVNTVQVPYLALPPVCVGEDADDGRHGAGFVREHLDSNARVEVEAQQVVYHAESVLLVEEVYARDAGEHVELQIDMLLEHIHSESNVLLSHYHACLVFDANGGDGREHSRDACEDAHLSSTRLHPQRASERQSRDCTSEHGVGLGSADEYGGGQAHSETQRA